MRLMGKSFFVITLLLLLFVADKTTAQSFSFGDILENYQYNKYRIAASQSEQYLLEHPTISKDSAIVLLEINAVCNFALGSKTKAKASFFKILKLDEQYFPDPKLISPKIIRYFNAVRNDYFTLKETFAQKEKEEAGKKEIVLPYNTLVEQKKDVAFGATLSLLFPGAGHIYLEGANVKNVTLVSATSLLLIGSAYMIYRTESLRSDYLSEVDPALITEKYDDYNSAYKTRNIVLASYFAVWAFAQLDFFWLSSDELFGGSFDLSYRNYDDAIVLNFRKRF